MRETGHHSNPRIGLACALCVTAVLLLIATAHGQPSPQASQRVPITDIVAILRQLEQLEYDLTGSFEATQIVTIDSKQVKSVTTKVSTKPGHKHVWIRSETGEEVVYSRSPRYTFAILKRNNGEQWQLATFTNDIDTVVGENFELRVLGRYGLCILHPLGTILTNTLTSKYCEANADEIRSVPSNRAGRETLIIARSGKPTTIVEIQKTSNGLPFVVSTKIANEATSDLQLFIKDVSDDKTWPGSDLPQCKAIRAIVRNERQQRVYLDARVEFVSFSSVVPDDDMFLLSTYGLPEPLCAVPIRSARRWAWLLLGAACCSIALVVLRRVRQRGATSD
jgi:hypothetical protein